MTFHLSHAFYSKTKGGGLLFGVVLGAVTGYFNAAVGLLYVIAGTLGVLAGSGNRKTAVSFLVCIISSCTLFILQSVSKHEQFFLLMIVACICGLLVNLIGLLQPVLISGEQSRDFGFAIVTPSVVWFLGALLFLAVFCIPCMTVASANLCSCCWNSGESEKKVKGSHDERHQNTLTYTVKSHNNYNGLNQEEVNILERMRTMQHQEAMKKANGEDSKEKKNVTDEYEITDIYSVVESKSPPDPQKTSLHSKKRKERKKD